MRLVVRKERSHSGAQLRFTGQDGLRLTAFVANTASGALPALELRHRRRTESLGYGPADRPHLRSRKTPPRLMEPGSPPAVPGRLTPTRTANQRTPTSIGPTPAPRKNRGQRSRPGVVSHGTVHRSAFAARVCMSSNFPRFPLERTNHNGREHFREDVLQGSSTAPPAKLPGIARPPLTTQANPPVLPPSRPPVTRQGATGIFWDSEATPVE